MIFVMQCIWFILNGDVTSTIICGQKLKKKSVLMPILCNERLKSEVRSST